MLSYSCVNGTFNKADDAVEITFHYLVLKKAICALTEKDCDLAHLLYPTIFNNFKHE